MVYSIINKENMINRALETILDLRNKLQIQFYGYTSQVDAPIETENQWSLERVPIQIHLIVG